jgi:hypothetical protein
MRRICLLVLFFTSLLYQHGKIQTAHFDYVTPHQEDHWSQILGKVQYRQAFLWLAPGNGPYRYGGIKCTAVYDILVSRSNTGDEIGFGLSLGYDNIKGHGGGIKVETKAGEETAFSVRLPTTAYLN